MTIDTEALRASHNLALVVAQYVELKKEGRELVGLCPFHTESTASFKVNPEKQIWACFGCGEHHTHGADVFGFIRSYFDCTFPEAIAKLQNGSGGHDVKPIPREPAPKKPARRTFPPPEGPPPSMTHSQLGEPAQVWTICTPEGAPYFYEARYMTDAGKETRFWTYGNYSESDAPRWECRHPMNPRPLYGLEQLAASPSAQVMIHEAAKKAEAGKILFPKLVHLALVGGVNVVRYTDVAPLAGRRVALLPDNDEVGRQAMNRLAPMLYDALAAEIKLLNPKTQPDGSLTPDGWDIADAEGWTPEVAWYWAKKRTAGYTHDAAPDAALNFGGDPPNTDSDALAAAPSDSPPLSAYGVHELSRDERQAQRHAERDAHRAANREAHRAAQVASGKFPGHFNGASHSASNGAVEYGVISRRLSDIEFKPIHWLWADKIPCGKVSMIVGNPGLGKSQVTASLAAVVTTGGKWPVCRTQAPLGSVIILSAEDDPEDTIGPRLEAAGADTSKVHILDAIRVTDELGEESTRGFNLSLDIVRLVTLMNDIGDVKLVIIDPVSAYMGKSDSHNNAEVRGVLSPLTAAAARAGAAIVIVSHLNKSTGQEALLRTQGSIGFTAAARAVWGVAVDKENPQRRLFMPLKNNLGTDKTGLAYVIEEFWLAESDPKIKTSRIMWENEVVNLSAEEVFSQTADEERTHTSDAKNFLADLLQDGAVKTADIQLAARKAGLAWATVRRAKDQMKITARRGGGIAGAGSWSWEMPRSSAASRDYTGRED